MALPVADAIHKYTLHHEKTRRIHIHTKPILVKELEKSNRAADQVAVAAVWRAKRLSKSSPKSKNLYHDFHSFWTDQRLLIPTWN